METRVGRRDLALVAVTIVGLSRLLDGPLLWLVAALLLGALLLGSLQVLAEDDSAAHVRGVPIESLILPTVAGIACLGVIRLVPFSMLLAPALLAVGILVDRCLALEQRLLASPDEPSAEERTAILVAILLVGFIGFTGVAAVVPGGLVDGIADGTGGRELAESDLVLLAGVDALIAALLGYRAAALRLVTLSDTLWSALTYGLVIAVGAAALRAMAIPRLMGPALLILAFYLWDAFHGVPPARRRDLRWIWQTLALIAVGAIVVAWNLLLRP
jgi:hypothetical protein